MNNSVNINDTNLSSQKNNNNPSNEINTHFNIPINDNNKKEKQSAKEIPHTSERTYIYDQDDTKSFFR